MKCNAMKTDEGLTVCMQVQREDEKLNDCIRKMFEIVRENGVHLSSILLDRGFSYEPVISAVLVRRRAEFSKPMDIVATVKNYTQSLTQEGRAVYYMEVQMVVIAKIQPTDGH